MTNRIFEKLGKFLKKSRIDAGLTQQEVSEKLGFSTAQYISNWERGMSTPPLQNLHTIVDLYNLDAEHFLKEILEVQKMQMQLQFEHKKKKIERLIRRKR